ncbi:MAG TPA: helix-turn-helix domain-containing protein [Candidatus Paceibacterota bacterium]
MSGGRPSKYKAEYVQSAAKLCRLGATDRDIADFFEVNEATLHRWKLAHPEFSESLKRSKDELDAQVERSLYQRATGYSHRSEKVFQFQGAIVRAETVEHYAPDPTSMIFWLKNRQPEKWRDRREVLSDDGKNPLDDPNPDV